MGKKSKRQAKKSRQSYGWAAAQERASQHNLSRVSSDGVYLHQGPSDKTPTRKSRAATNRGPSRELELKIINAHMARYGPEPVPWTPTNRQRWTLSDQLNWIERNDPFYTHSVKRRAPTAGHP